MPFEFMVFVVGVLAGGVASVTGFAIGSFLTPVLALRLDTKLAVAAVSVPHLIGTVMRFLTLKKRIDKRVLLHFGILSAVGGLIGALLQSRASSPALEGVFGLLLIFAGLSGLTTFSRRMRFSRRAAWLAGTLSGLFGGMVGNQGGIRSAALLGFDVSRESLVATATAVGLIVDGARMPVYAATQGEAMAGAWVSIAIATAGVLLGTFVGLPLLRRISEPVFRTSLSLAITALGIYMSVRALRG